MMPLDRFSRMNEGYFSRFAVLKKNFISKAGFIFIQLKQITETIPVFTLSYTSVVDTTYERKHENRTIKATWIARSFLIHPP